ncbi:MAG: fimbria/pilus periplasmic chaperone [Woeseiaceae bacterium]
MRFFFSLLAAMALLLHPIAAQAVSVTPIVVDLEAAGSGSAKSIAVTNPTERPMPIEITVEEITIDEIGTIVSAVDAGDDFIILPPQTTIPAGDTQNFRIQYLGEPDLQQGKLYRFAVNQIPVPTEENGAFQVQVVYSITGLATLSPLQSAAQIAVVAQSVVLDDNGEPRASITLENTGNKPAYFSRGALDIKQVSASGETLWRENLPPSRIEREIGFGILMPNQTRTFVLPYALPSSDGIVEAEFELLRG